VSSAFATYPSLKHVVFVVSGGASGIGADIVAAAHAQHARVVFLDILEEEGRALAARHAGSTFMTCDLTDMKAIARTVADIRKSHGAIGVLVNNAANDDRRNPADIDEKYWDWSMDVNLKHQFFLCQEVLPHMQELGGGSIINFSSIAWRFGADMIAAYAVAKSAVIGMTRVLSRNYGAFNIRVNAIEPGAVMTEKQRKLWYPTQDDVDQMVNRQKLKRMLTGDEVARAVMFLAAEDSRMITGQSLIVDAGMS
jgi:D-xylose 1-dehydrogenase